MGRIKHGDIKVERKGKQSDCKYPDWEGGLIVGPHQLDKDSFCDICGEKVEKEKESKSMVVKEDYQALYPSCRFCGSYFTSGAWFPYCSMTCYVNILKVDNVS